MSEKMIEMAVRAFEYKLTLPQYAAYLDNPEALDWLLRDTLREYGIAEQCLAGARKATSGRTA